MKSGKAQDEFDEEQYESGEVQENGKQHGSEHVCGSVGNATVRLRDLLYLG